MVDSIVEVTCTVIDKGELRLVRELIETPIEASYPDWEENVKDCEPIKPQMLFTNEEEEFPQVEFLEDVVLFDFKIVGDNRGPHNSGMEAELEMMSYQELFEKDLEMFAKEAKRLSTPAKYDQPVRLLALYEHTYQPDSSYYGGDGGETSWEFLKFLDLTDL